MASIVDICNDALQKLSVNEISSLNDDSEAARFFKARYADLRDTLLQMHPWNFAQRRTGLAQLITTPEYEFAYEHQLPTNPYCLKVEEVEDNVEYRIEGRKLLSNNTTVNIVYTARITDVNDFQFLFREALATYLAAQAAWKLTGSVSLRDSLLVEFGVILADAKVRDSQEGTPRKRSRGGWVNGRYSSLNSSDTTFTA
jgi:hypothetical protein